MFKLRTVKSYVRRQGRITARQEQALEEYWPRYGVEANSAINFIQLFGNHKPVALEIGFGMGDALLGMAQNHPELNFFGIEVHRPGVGALIANLAEQNIQNVRVCIADATQVLEHFIPNASLQMIMIYFPDPWQKQRHQKRRLIQTKFIELLAKKLKPQAQLHLATDWVDYAEQMMQVVSANNNFINAAGEGQYSLRPDYRPLTKFELRGTKLGHSIYDLIFIRKENEYDP